VLLHALRGPGVGEHCHVFGTGAVLQQGKCGVGHEGRINPALFHGGDGTGGTADAQPCTGRHRPFCAIHPFPPDLVHNG
jgi:hypothetical protein